MVEHCSISRKPHSAWLSGCIYQNIAMSTYADYDEQFSFTSNKIFIMKRFVTFFTFINKIRSAIKVKRHKVTAALFARYFTVRDRSGMGKKSE